VRGPTAVSNTLPRKKPWEPLRKYLDNQERLRVRSRGLAKKIRKAGTAEGGDLFRLILTLSLVSLPGILAVLAALWGVMPWLYAIIIFIVTMVVGWIFMLKAMRRMGTLRSLRRTIDIVTINHSQKRP
jgi:fatty acid desaturase